MTACPTWRRIDHQEFERAGRDRLEPITFSGASLTLREGLSKLLAGSRLDWVIGKDDLLITTPEAAARSRRPSIPKSA